MESEIYPDTPLVPSSTTPISNPKSLDELSLLNIVLKNENTSSPEPNCAICLGKSENTSFTDSCFHQFCFSCLLEWSKVQPICPLCKQPFRTIIYNIRSNDQYDQYNLPPPPPQNSADWTELQIVQMGQRFRYRTTMTNERIHHSFIYNYIPPSTCSRNHAQNIWSRHNTSSDFRRSIYYNSMWAEPITDITGRYRECSSQFFRENTAATHRLVPWLSRELNAILVNPTNSMYVLELILNLISNVDVTSFEFRQQIAEYFQFNTDHFIHEFYQFARSPYDMVGYDRHARYIQRSTSHRTLLEYSDNDSDVIILSPDRVNSCLPNRVLSETHNPEPPNYNFESSISDFSQPSTSNCHDTMRTDVSSDGIEILEIVKPRHERTPLIVTLSGTDEEELKPKRRNSIKCYIYSDTDSSPTSRHKIKRRKKRRIHNHKSEIHNESDSETEIKSTPYRPKINRSKFKASTDSEKKKRNDDSSPIQLNTNKRTHIVSDSDCNHCHKAKKKHKHKHKKKKRKHHDHDSSDSSCYSKPIKLKIKIGRSRKSAN